MTTRVRTMTHDTLGDLASLLGPDEHVRLRRDGTRGTWLASLVRGGEVLDYGEADTLEAAMAQLVATLEAVAADAALIDDRAPMLSAERDNR